MDNKKNNLEIKKLARLIGIINSFAEVFENITTMPLYGLHFPPIDEQKLIQYQELRRLVIRENIHLNISGYDGRVAESTLILNQTPLYLAS